MIIIVIKAYFSACSGFKMACKPLTQEPSLILANEICFCLRTDRTQPWTVTDYLLVLLSLLVLSLLADSNDRIVGEEKGLVVSVV